MSYKGPYINNNMSIVGIKHRLLRLMWLGVFVFSVATFPVWLIVWVLTGFNVISRALNGTLTQNERR